jgi:hypothetical protein
LCGLLIVEGDAEGDEVGVEVGDGEAHPGLVLVVGAKVDGGAERVVDAAAAGDHVVGDVGDVVVEVVDAAAVQELGVGDEAAAVDEDAGADLIGALVDGGVGRGLDLVEVELAAPVGARGEVDVAGAAEEMDGREVVVGVGEDEADTELEVAGAAGGRHGLGG